MVNAPVSPQLWVDVGAEVVEVVLLAVEVAWIVEGGTLVVLK